METNVLRTTVHAGGATVGLGGWNKSNPPQTIVSVWEIQKALYAKGIAYSAAITSSRCSNSPVQQMTV